MNGFITESKCELGLSYKENRKEKDAKISSGTGIEHRTSVFENTDI